MFTEELSTTHKTVANVAALKSRFRLECTAHNGVPPPPLDCTTRDYFAPLGILSPLAPACVRASSHGPFHRPWFGACRRGILQRMLTVHTNLPASLHVADPISVYPAPIPPPAVMSSCFTCREPPRLPCAFDPRASPPLTAPESDVLCH